MRDLNWIDFGGVFSGGPSFEESFVGQKLNRPGTLIEIEDRGDINRYLIGDINTIGGVCDDCTAFIGGKTVVKRYAVVWEA